MSADVGKRPSLKMFGIAGFCLSVVLGLASRKLPPTGFFLWDKSFGDADYAVMFGFLVLALRPRSTPVQAGLAGFGICFALELFQLTGLPLRTPQPLRFLLGTSFAWHDVACYAVGGAAVAAMAALYTRFRSTRR